MRRSFQHSRAHGPCKVIFCSEESRHLVKPETLTEKLKVRLIRSQNEERAKEYDREMRDSRGGYTQRYDAQ